MGPLDLAITAVSLFEIAILIACAMSWFRADPRHPVVRALRQVTEPVLARVRRALPVQAGRIDFSPLVVLVALEVLRALLERLRS